MKNWDRTISSFFAVFIYIIISNLKFPTWATLWTAATHITSLTKLETIIYCCNPENIAIFVLFVWQYMTWHIFSMFQIKARVLTGEVIATYNIDEVSMELFVYLTKNHPLGMLKVDSGKRIGVTSAQWRKWMLQLTIYLHHQVGNKKVTSLQGCE